HSSYCAARGCMPLPGSRTVHVSFAGTTTLSGEAKATRTAGRLRANVETFGAGRLRLTVALSGGWERLVAVLTARSPNRKAIVVSEGGINTRAMTGKHALTIRLISDATPIPKGSKLTLTL